MATWLFLKLHFHRTNGSALGPGRAAILEAIDRFGSLTSAARALGITYRQVWNVVQTINTDFEGLVEVKRGRHGGGAVLTPKAIALLKEFRQIERKFYDVFADDLKRLEEIIGEAPGTPQPIPRDVQIIDPKLLPPPEGPSKDKSAKGRPAKSKASKNEGKVEDKTSAEQTSPAKTRAKPAQAGTAAPEAPVSTGASTGASTARPKKARKAP